MAHSFSQEAENILDVPFPVLDKGFVRLVDYMGTDERIVQAARVSYAGKGTKSFREDVALIDHLLRNDHTSPFEQVVLTFHMKLPIFIARQMIRHRTARLNEISGRYSVMENEFYIPKETDIAQQSKDNKQGRSNEPMDSVKAQQIIDLLERGQEEAYSKYNTLIESGLARELARINLPLSLYTEWYWQIDLHNLFRFLALRLDPHAQKEIRDYAEVMLKIAKAVAPMATKSFEEHLLHGVRFSKRELIELRSRLCMDQARREEDLLNEKEMKRFEEKILSGRQL